MTDSTSNPTMQEGLGNPPAKRPCLDPSSAASDLADTALDEGSDFYNTPLNGTPLHTTQPTMASSDNNNISMPGTPQKPRPQIPGLSLCNESGNDIPFPMPEQPAEPNGAASSLRHVLTATNSSPTDTPQSIEFMYSSKDQTEVASTDNTVMNPNENTSLPPATSGNANAQESTSSKVQPSDETMQVAQEAVYDGIISFSKDTPVPGAQLEGGGEPEWEVDSSPYESSSSDSSDSSSSDDSDEDEGYNLLAPEEQAKILMSAEGGSEDEGEGKTEKKEIRTANEKEDEIVPIPDITVTPDMKVEMLGNIEAIVDNMVLVKANISGEYQVLEAGSLLCLANLNVIGVVSETLGKVEQPLYTIRFSSTTSAKDMGLEKGIPVFYVEDHSTFVFTQPLKGLKGSDASNFHDEEVGEEEIEFSDDEAEAQYKRQLKLKRQQKKDGRPNQTGNRRGRRGAAPNPSGLRHSELSYDDVTMDDGYTPLPRPKNLHEMLGSHEAPLEEPRPQAQLEKAFRGGRGRGRVGGQSRGGRGGRGRGRGYQPRGDDNQGYTQEQLNSPGYPQPPTNQHPSHPYSPYQQQQQQASYNHFQPPPQIPQGSGYPTPVPPPQYSPQSFPFSQPFQQQQAPPYPPPGSHINPAFFASASRQAQLSPISSPHQPPEDQAARDPFAEAQAQLDLLRRLSKGGT